MFDGKYPSISGDTGVFISPDYSHDAIPGKNGACDDLKPGRRLKDSDKTIHGNSWEWWKHELEPVSFLCGAISIEQAGELPSGSLTMSNCLYNLFGLEIIIFLLEASL